MNYWNLRNQGRAKTGTLQNKLFALVSGSWDRIKLAFVKEAELVPLISLITTKQPVGHKDASTWAYTL